MQELAKLGQTILCHFSNAPSIFKIMICNQNVPKLVHTTLLSSNYIAQALNFSELLKNKKIFNENRAKKDNYQVTKMTINQCKIPYTRKKHIFSKNVLLYIINNLYVVLDIIISKFSYSLKIMSRNTFPEPQPYSASYGH